MIGKSNSVWELLVEAQSHGEGTIKDITSGSCIDNRDGHGWKQVRAAISFTDTHRDLPE
jgi:hypothetical protein